MSKPEAVESRLNMLVRILGAIFLVLGAAIAYYTSATPLVPQLSPVFYLLSTLLIISGVVSLISKLK